MDSTKRYEARVHLGVKTETYDGEGEVIAKQDASHVTREDVERALQQFVGNIEQMPPMYSAIKQGGKKLYDLAREGKTVEREARKVRIDSIKLMGRNVAETQAEKGGDTGGQSTSEQTIDAGYWVGQQTSQFVIEVTCSAGTYIRSLAYDIGEALGVGAHLTGLVRTASGMFTLENAVPLDTLLTNPAAYLIAPVEALRDDPVVVLDAAAEADIMHGRSIAGDLPEGETVFAYGGQNRLIAVLEAQEGRLRPRKVFNQDNQDNQDNLDNERTESE